MWEPTVGSVMTKEIVTARPDVPFKELVALMSEHGVSGLPVVDVEGKPVGVVSEADTLAKQEYRGGTAPRPWLPGRQRRARWHKAAGQTAAELMTAPAIVIRHDVIGTFLRDDDAILADVEEHVFRRGMWLAPETMTIEVTGGVVTLDGAVERRTTAQVAGGLTRAVPGVVAVHNKLRYELDDTVSTAL
jgi:CBS domain containing-hemolysin-like protein